MSWASGAWAQKLYRARDGFVPERNEIHMLERHQLYRRRGARTFEPPSSEIAVGPVRAPYAKPFLHRTDDPGVGNNHDVSAKCKCPEASHSRLDALVEGAQLFPAGENNQAALAPQLDFARPPSGYFGHSEAVPFTDVVLAPGPNRQLLRVAAPRPRGTCPPAWPVRSRARIVGRPTSPASGRLRSRPIGHGGRGGVGPSGHLRRQPPPVASIQ